MFISFLGNQGHRDWIFFKTSKFKILEYAEEYKHWKFFGFIVEFEANWVDLTCRMLLIGILLRPNFILKDEYQQGIFVRKIELVLDKKDDA